MTELETFPPGSVLLVIQPALGTVPKFRALHVDHPYLVGRPPSRVTACKRTGVVKETTFVPTPGGHWECGGCLRELARLARSKEKT